MRSDYYLQEMCIFSRGYEAVVMWLRSGFYPCDSRVRRLTMWFPMAPRPMNPIVLALSVGIAIADVCEKFLSFIEREIEVCEGLKVRLPCR